MSAPLIRVVDKAERWLPITGYEGKYEVSDLGRVRSLDRFDIYTRLDQYNNRPIQVRRQHFGRVLRPGVQDSGHLSVVLGRNNTKQVHSLVLTAFKGPCPDGLECLHGDGVPSNNHISNLRWGTRSENLIDAVRHGSKLVGEQQLGSKLRNEDIPMIRGLFGKLPLVEIAKQYGVTESAIRQIRSRKSWKHIPETAQC